ncbi:MAG: sigma-70 family RNA polymerase sigma factor [Pseudomonadota bacterium]
MPPTDVELQDLYQRYAPVIHRRAWSLMGNEEDAADAVQETFARVIVHWDAFRGEASPLTWMYRISTNHCLNRMRDRRARADKRAVHRAEFGGDGFEGGEEEFHDGARVRRLLALADDETRAIVVHLFFDEMTREEAARIVGISVPTLRKRLNAFLKRARKALEGNELAVVTGALMLAFAFLPLLLSLWGRS